MPSKGVVLFADVPAVNGHRRGASEVLALEPVANRPIAHHVLDALLAAEVDQLVLAGPADVLIDVRACLRGYSPQPSQVDYAVTAENSGLIGALRAVHPFVGAAPCVVHLADGLLGEPLAPYLALTRDALADLLLLRPGAVGELQRDGLPEESSPSRPNTDPSVDADAGIGVFGPGALAQACQAKFRGEAPGSKRLAEHFANQGRYVEIRCAERWRRYRGDPTDLLELNRLALDGLVTLVPRTIGQENRIEGPVNIDPTASVTGSVIVGPVVVGAGAEIASAYIGPYTSIGSQARIEGAEIERSIISPGATVRHVGGRLAGSLVGPNARIFRDFSLPRAIRVRVSAGDEVGLC
ncbi:MAG: hypothetical protein ACR2NR_21680 [Solirubrobacteraceae bacterium]